MATESGDMPRQKTYGLGMKSWMTSSGSKSVWPSGPESDEALKRQPMSSLPSTMWLNWSGGRTRRFSIFDFRFAIGRIEPDLSRATMKASPRRQNQVTMNSQKRKRFKYGWGRLKRSTAA